MLFRKDWLYWLSSWLSGLGVCFRLGTRGLQFDPRYKTNNKHKDKIGLCKLGIFQLIHNTMSAQNLSVFSCVAMRAL